LICHFSVNNFIISESCDAPKLVWELFGLNTSLGLGAYLGIMAAYLDDEFVVGMNFVCE